MIVSPEQWESMIELNEKDRMEKFWTEELTSRSVSVPGWGKSEGGNYLAESARSYWKAWQVARNEVEN